LRYAFYESTQRIASGLILDLSICRPNPNRFGASMRASITGIVVPAKWDEANNVIGVSIQGTDEMEYEVENEQDFMTVAALCGERVRVWGEVETHQGATRIRILKYELIPS
jgi:hypothetical protein